MEENLQLNRILNMFNTQSKGEFNYGGIKIFRNSMNQWENTSYELISKGQQKYQFTADNLGLFSGYTIKIVMSGTNQAYPPRIKELRTLAVR